MKLFFLDESGDHSLDAIDVDYPVFVLGGIIVDRTHYREEIEPRVERLKSDILGNPGAILHTTDIIRAKNGFEPLTDPEIRAAFYNEVNAMMRDLRYVVVACAIKKHAFRAAHPEQSVDPYVVCLEIVLDHFCSEIGAVSDGGLIFAERRRPDLDRVLESQWRRIRERGTDRLRREFVNERVVDLSLKDKRANLAGLQLADLVVSPVGRHVIGKRPTPDWEIVASKVRQGTEGGEGSGLIVLP